MVNQERYLYCGTMQKMSIHETNQEEVKAWGEAMAARPHGRVDLPELLGEVENCDDPMVTGVQEERRM